MGYTTAEEDFSTKYRGDDFLDWYKSNYGKDYDPAYGSPNFAGLNGVDSAIGQSLYNYYQLQNNAEENYTKQTETIKSGYDSTLDELKTQYDSDTQLLLDRYGNAIEALDKSKSNSQQSASITLDKLKKYLPMQIKAQGLGGLGVSESTMLQAHNNYNNQMGEIEANYNTQKSAVDTNFNENKASYDSTYNTSTADINAEKESRLAELLNNYSGKVAEYKVGAGADSSKIFDAYNNKYETQQEQLRQEELAKQEQLRREELARQEEVTNQARGTVENALANMYIDTANLYNETTLTESGYNRIKSYLDKNRNALGESNYQAKLGELDSWTKRTNTTRDKDFNSAISTFKNSTNFNSQLSLMSEAFDTLESERDSLSDSEYNTYLGNINSGTRADYNNYYVQGLGSGRKNDDIDITIGSTKRNGKTEYDLLCGDEVTNEKAKSLLNKLTTGAASITPTNGRLCVVANKMYIYTSKGWKNVIGDHSSVEDAIKAFLNS